MESTQAVARQLADGGAPEGTAVVAREQTAGRGRLGNSFYSPPGGLYLSLVLRPSLPPGRMPLIGLAAGVAVAEAVRDVTGLQPVLKWPNDVLLGGRKLSGLLIELVTRGEGGSYAILGVGLNANVPAAQFSSELRMKMTSILSELGREVDLDELLRVLLQRLEQRCSDLSRVLDDWRAAPNTLGQRVRLAAGKEVLQGVAHDVDFDGALLVALPNGETRRCVAAEVQLLR